METDFWSMGVSLVDDLAPQYIKDVCLPADFLPRFKDMLPADGSPRPVKEVEKFLLELRRYYSPICDKKTWKDCKLPLNGGGLTTIGEVYGPILEKLLERPDIGCECSFSSRYSHQD